MRRSGFSLVELVIAIVVIAISVMTIPLMLQQSAKSTQFGMMQEVILAARTKMANILSYPWDDNAVEVATSYVRVIDVQNGNAFLDRNETTLDTNRRIGHIPANKRRRFVEGNLSTPTYPSTAVDTNISDLNDFDDKNSTVIYLGAPVTTGFYDYLDQNITLSSKVYYLADGADYNETTLLFDLNVSTKAPITDLSKTTNIKMIELELQSQNYDTFMFRTFSCNIGQTLYLEKDAP